MICLTHTSKSDNTVSGSFKVVLARYLHFYADLDYQRQDDRKNINTEAIGTPTDGATVTKERNKNLISKQTYPMQIHRRMRSKELHYIDHPLVGMLILINPIEKVKVTSQ